MENYVRVRSQQGQHDVSGNLNLVDFLLPPNSGSYDLSKSYIAVTCSVNVTSPAIAGTDALANSDAPVYDSLVLFAESGRGGGAVNGADVFSQLQNDSSILVKNINMYTSKGRVENIRNVDCLRSNLATYTKSFNKIANGSYSMSNLIRQDQFRGQPLNTLNGEGSVKSRNNSHEIRIPLNQLLNVANSEIWDSSNYGFTKFECEMNFNKLVGYDYFSAMNIPDKKPDNNAPVKYSAIDPFTATAQIDANAIGTDAFNLGSANPVLLITTLVYESLEKSPFFVNQRIKINSVAQATIANVQCQIKSITHIKSGAKKGKLLIFLDEGINSGVIANGTVINDLVISPVVPTAQNVLISNVELVTKKTSQKDNQPLQYTTYVSQEDTVAAQASINRNYLLPANTQNVYIMFNNPIISSEDLNNYRLTINGQDLTQRQIRVNSGLHYDLLSNVFNNAGMSMGSLEEKKFLVTGLMDADATSINTVILAAPVPLNGQQNQLNVELNATTGQTLSGRIIIYSEVIKEI